MNHRFATWTVAVLLLAGAATSWADVSQPMVKFNNVSPGVNLTVYDPFYPAGTTFDVGVFNIFVDLPDNLGPFAARAFCLDLKQFTSTDWRPYAVNPLEVAPQDGGSPFQAMGVAKANAIRELWGEQYASVVNNATAAAFQSAIWEIIYEDQGANGWDLTTGNLRISDAAVAATANLWLSQVGDASQTLEGGLIALTSNVGPTKWQDFVYDTGSDRPPVPEPLTVATVAMSIGSLGLYVRRRTQA